MCCVLNDLWRSYRALYFSQEEEAASGKAVYRTTVMFSATMPPAVERLAQVA